jgi:hypothetical protein
LKPKKSLNNQIEGWRHRRRNTARSAGNTGEQMSNTLETSRRYGGSGFLRFGLFILSAALTFLFAALAVLSEHVIGASLPLLAIGGVILLVLLLIMATMIFSILGLANKDQAMGLPEGSIRAVIALSLIVLFTILSVFLYKGVSETKVNTIVQLSDMERKQFIREHANLPDIRSAISEDDAGKKLVARDAEGKALQNPDGTSQYLYDVTYSSSPNAASQDFAKQLLVLLGTLMTAITSFYLGAGTATSAAAAGQTAASPPPTLSGIKPTSHSISNDGAVLHLAIMGANLNNITHVKIVRSGTQPIIGATVGSSPTQITCDLDVRNAAPGAWDVVVDDGGSRSVSLSGALTITA